MRELFVLVVVAPDIDIESLGGAVVVRAARHFARSAPVGTAPVKLQVSAVRELAADVRKVGLVRGKFERLPHGLKVRQLLAALGDVRREGLAGALELAVSLVIALGVVHDRECRVESDRDLGIVVVVRAGEGLRAGHGAVAVGRQQLAADAEPVLLLRVGKLFLLQVELLGNSLDGGLYRAAQLGGFLPDARRCFLRLVVVEQELTHGIKGFGLVVRKIGVHRERHRGKLRGDAALEHAHRGVGTIFRCIPKPCQRLAEPCECVIVTLCDIGDGVETGAVGKFVGDHGADAGDRRVDRSAEVARACAHGSRQGRDRLIPEGVLVRGVRNEIRAAGKHLADGTDHRGDTLDAVDDRLVVIAENDVRVFAHQLDDEPFDTRVTHLVEVLDLHADDALQTGLLHREDPGAA